MLRAVPESVEMAHQLSAWMQATHGVDIDLTHMQDAMRQSFEQMQAAAAAATDFMPAAYAADAAEPAQAAVDAAQEAAKELTNQMQEAAGKPPIDWGTDPNVKYIIGPNGSVLIEPSSGKPLTDDWWNGFVGVQSNFIKQLDEQMRGLGVPGSFGWSIVLYTGLIKTLFYPFQKDTLRSTAKMQLISPKVKQIKEQFKDDEETQAKILKQLYTALDIDPLGGCLPVLFQLPIFWSLYSVWRRLSAENYAHYGDPFLWIPSLAKPNPDFQLKLDWLFDWTGDAPTMGWEEYIGFLIIPVALISNGVYSAVQGQLQKMAKEKEEEQNWFIQALPFLSIYLIGTLSLELPAAVSLYYAVNTFGQLAQTELVKQEMRGEIAGYDEFERTGEFPEGALEQLAANSQPPPTSLHQAALGGDIRGLAMLLDKGELDVNAADEKLVHPLGYACATGSKPAVKLLLKRGARLDVKDGNGNTPLHYASGYGHIEVVKELLEVYESDDEWKELRNGKGQTVLDAARVNRRVEVLDFLRERLGQKQEDDEVIRNTGVDDEVIRNTGVDDEVIRNTGGAAALEASEGAAEEEFAWQHPLLNPGEVMIPKAVMDEAAATVAFAAGLPSPGNIPAPQMAMGMLGSAERLKKYPGAVQKARDLLLTMHPQMLSTLTGGKMEPEQAKSAMEAMRDLSPEEVLAKATAAGNSLLRSVAPAAPRPVPEPAMAGAKSARVVD